MKEAWRGQVKYWNGEKLKKLKKTEKIEKEKQ